jgi:hypothetical protein
MVEAGGVECGHHERRAIDETGESTGTGLNG